MKLFNSLSQQKEEFVPLTPGQVSMYVCGITPYDTTHLGHAFTYTVFDALNRYLKFKKYSVNYVQNVTDIDDDILKKASEGNKNWIDLGDFWTKKFLKDLKSINVLMPNHYVKATDSIPKIVEMVSKLVAKKFAYENQGNVYFEFKKFPDFDKLSHFNEKQMLLLMKDRGGDPNDSRKKAPLDFLLWQKSASGEPWWDSPWGKGRPGWHIECSAMINQYLGSQIDIHGGGRDLIFPHHSSEIAQSETFSGKKPYVKYWMHISMVMYQGEKMSKSLGNLVLISDLLKKFSPNAIRWMLLSHHYRTPWEFTNDEIKKVSKKAEKLDKLKLHASSEESSQLEDFRKIMDDDLNLPAALELLSLELESKNYGAASLIATALGFRI